MKRTTILYWTFTLLFAAFMCFSSIPDIMLTKEAVAFMSGTLGIPDYMTRFLGILKLAGIIAILVPGFPRLKEWAYAGFAFDLFGATYWLIMNTLSKGADVDPRMLFMLVPILLGAGSYIFYHRRRKQQLSLGRPVP